MKSSNNEPASNRKTVEVIRNAHTVAEQRAIGKRWTNHTGPRMTLADILVHAANLEQEKEKQLAE